MANRHWILGTGAWDASTTTHWSASSGGSGGASVPTSSDNVIFDSASNATAYTVTLTAAANCLDLTLGNPASGVVTVAGSSTLNCYGSFSTASGALWTQGFPGSQRFKATSTGKTILTNGVNFTNVIFDGVGGGWSLSDALIVGSNGVTLTNGSFNANNFNVTIPSFSSANTNTRTLTMGSGTWDLNSFGGVWDLSVSTGMTLNAGTSTIKYTYAPNAVFYFFGGGLTYNNLWFAGAGTSTYSIDGSNTFNEFKVDSGLKTITFYEFTVNTFTTFLVSGTPGNLVTLSSVGGGNHTLTKAGGGTISRDYLSISKSTATPSNTWYAGNNSTNGGSNSGWGFTPPVIATAQMMLVF